MAKLNKEEAIAKVTEGEGEFHVSTIEEHESFLNNLKDTEVFKEQIDLRAKEMYDGVDNVFEVISNTKRDYANKEKTTEYMTRVLKSMVSDIESKSSEIAKLGKVVNDKSGTEALELLKGELDSMKKKHQTFKDDADIKYSELEKSGVKMRILNEFDRAMTGMKFKDAAIIPEDVREAMINNAKTELAKSADYVDSKLVFRDGEGKIMYNDQAVLLTAKEVLSEKLKSVIDAGRTAKGVDIEEPEIKEGEDGKVIVNISIPDAVKTNVDLTAHLMGLGMKRDSKEYRAAYAKYESKLKKLT